MIWVWFLGTIIGHYQATKGKCSLASWLGHGDELAAYANFAPELKVKRKKVDQVQQSHWLNIIRYSKQPEERRKALEILKERDMVEEF